LVEAAGMTRHTFRQKLKAQLAADLETSGFSKEEIATLSGKHKISGHYKGSHRMHDDKEVVD
jgi:hypothetical protein